MEICRHEVGSDVGTRRVQAEHVLGQEQQSKAGGTNVDGGRNQCRRQTSVDAERERELQ